MHCKPQDDLASLLFSAHCSCPLPVGGGGGGEQTMPATIQSTITNMNFWKRQQSRCLPQLPASLFTLLYSFSFFCFPPYTLAALGCSPRAFWLRFAWHWQGSPKGSSARWGSWRAAKCGTGQHSWCHRWVHGRGRGGGRGVEGGAGAAATATSVSVQFPHFFRAAAALTLKCRKNGQHTHNCSSLSLLSALSANVNWVEFTQRNAANAPLCHNSMPSRAEPCRAVAPQGILNPFAIWLCACGTEIYGKFLGFWVSSLHIPASRLGLA